MDKIQYYYDLQEMRDNLMEFAMKYSDNYSVIASTSQQNLLKFINEEIQKYEKIITKDIRSK
ncbi:MAG TPA: hypothetical protein PKI46_00775 [Bacteroidales bacterium]|nr:hypothetical protein [Bacteroidales bacterium]